MEELLAAELSKIFQAIVIHSPTAFTFAGRVPPPIDPLAQQMMGLAVSQQPLVTHMQQQFYQHCYCHKFTGELADESPAPFAEDGFSQELSAANTSRQHWDANWQIQQMLPSGQILADKHGRLRLFWPGEFILHEGHGLAPRAGAAISAFRPKESQTMQPGFYFAFGETLLDQLDDYHLVRFYWNLTDAGAASLLHFATRELNRFQVPFRIKCPTNRALFTRTDAAVLYVNKRFYRVAAELLGEVYHKVAEYLRPETPLFTKRLAAGLGLAEDPGNGESFGMHRCRLLAEAIFNAYAQDGQQTEPARRQALSNLFAHNGLDLQRPFLNPGASESYDFPAAEENAECGVMNKKQSVFHSSFCIHRSSFLSSVSSVSSVVKLILTQTKLLWANRTRNF